MVNEQLVELTNFLQRNEVTDPKERMKTSLRQRWLDMINVAADEGIISMEPVYKATFKVYINKPLSSQ